MYWTMLRVSWREGVPAMLRLSWRWLLQCGSNCVHGCGRVGLSRCECVDGCVGVSVCMGMHVHLSILLLAEETATSPVTTSGVRIPCNSPTLHMHTVTYFLSRSFLLPSPSLLPLPPPSPFSSSISLCSEVQHGSFSTWTVCTGVLWAILVRPLSATAVPSTCVRVSTMMSGLWGSSIH